MAREIRCSSQQMSKLHIPPKISFLSKLHIPPSRGRETVRPDRTDPKFELNMQFWHWKPKNWVRTTTLGQERGVKFMSFLDFPNRIIFNCFELIVCTTTSSFWWNWKLWSRISAKFYGDKIKNITKRSAATFWASKSFLSNNDALQKRVFCSWLPLSLRINMVESRTLFAQPFGARAVPNH